MQLRKLIFGNESADRIPAHSALEKRRENIKAIWNNKLDNDVGVEKLLRLFLAVSQFVFPGPYLKEYVGKFGVTYREIAVDAFVLFKMCFPFCILYNGWHQNSILFAIMLWFLTETLLYVPTLIFASDIYSKPRSYRRSMLLLFFNYIEIVLGFAVFYARGEYMNHAFTHWFDPIYFSFITAASIGYGDYYPITPFGKFLVSVQSILFLSYVVMFINFFSNKVEHKGYFEKR